MPAKRAPARVLRVSLAKQRPFPGEYRWGMVYVHPAGARPRAGRQDRTGLPLWFLTRSFASLEGLRASWDHVPPDRRHLRAWARGVRGLEVNVEVSDLGTVLQARYRVPEGIWLHHVFEVRKRGEVPRRSEGWRCVGSSDPGPATLEVSGTSFHCSLDPPESPAG